MLISCATVRQDALHHLFSGHHRGIGQSWASQHRNALGGEEARAWSDARLPQTTKAPAVISLPRLAGSRCAQQGCAGDALLPPVIQPGCARICMTGQILDLFQRNALRQEISHRRHAERMRRYPVRQSCRSQPSLDQAAHIDTAQRPVEQGILTPKGRAEQRRILGCFLQSRLFEVAHQHHLQVAANGDFPCLAALFEKTKQVLRPK